MLKGDIHFLHTENKQLTLYETGLWPQPHYLGHWWPKVYSERVIFIYHIFTLLSIELFMFIHSPIYYIFICLSTHLSTHVFIYSSIHSFTHSLTYLLIYCYSSFNYSHIYLFVYLFHSHLSFNSPKLYTVKFILIHLHK